MTRPSGGFDAEKLRREYPALELTAEGKKLVYFDSACTMLKPRRVADRLSEFYRGWGGCGGRRASHLAARESEEVVREARAAAARFLGADSPNEIVFTSGTTEAFNLVARAFPYEERRREVVVTDLEHNAAFLPFHEAAARGEIVLRLARSRDGRLDLNALEALISERTALVVATRASNVLGGVQPTAELCRLAHRRGALVMADEAQYLATHRERVAETNVDFAAFSAHKLGGPFGFGVLYGKENLLNRLRHYKVGGGVVKSVVWKGEAAPEVRYLDAPTRLEPGVPDFGGAAGLAEALRFLEEIPEAGLRAHVSALVLRAARGLARSPQVRVLGRPEDLASGSLVSFYPLSEEFSIPDFNIFLNQELGDRFVAVRAGEHCAHLLHQSLGIPATVRLSFFGYNTEAEVDFFLDALDAYLKAAVL